MRSILYSLFIISISSLPAHSSRQETVSLLFSSVENWIGSGYLYGGLARDGIDCSGFVQEVYREVFGIALPRTVYLQKQLGEAVADKLEPGDLLFFDIDGFVSHVGIYVFEDKFIHAASSGPQTGVIKSSLKEKYYKDRYAFARRIVKLEKYAGEAKVASKDQKPEVVSDASYGIAIGKVFFRGRLYELSDNFEAGLPLFLEIRKLSAASNECVVVIKNYTDPAKTKRFRHPPSDRPATHYKIVLEKGRYGIGLYNDDNEMTPEKIIVVN